MLFKLAFAGIASLSSLTAEAAALPGFQKGLEVANFSTPALPAGKPFMLFNFTVANESGTDTSLTTLHYDSVGNKAVLSPWDPKKAAPDCAVINLSPTAEGLANTIYAEPAPRCVVTQATWTLQNETTQPLGPLEFPRILEEMPSRSGIDAMFRESAEAAHEFMAGPGYVDAVKSMVTTEAFGRAVDVRQEYTDELALLVMTATGTTFSPGNEELALLYPGIAIFVPIFILTIIFTAVFAGCVHHQRFCILGRNDCDVDLRCCGKTKAHYESFCRRVQKGLEQAREDGHH